jgi:hypothetical protein
MWMSKVALLQKTADGSGLFLLVLSEDQFRMDFVSGSANPVR